MGTEPEMRTSSNVRMCDSEEMTAGSIPGDIFHNGSKNSHVSGRLRSSRPHLAHHSYKYLSEIVFHSILNLVSIFV